MTTDALLLPADIPWRRLAYAADMIDTNFGDLAMPPKWRSSLAVYCHVVPVEQTEESYPEGRIVYLRLTCSITGWNPREDLLYPETLVEIPDDLDDFQRSAWEAIAAAGWARTYWPCLGAIAQIAVYPSSGEQTDPDDYPFIVDFEPKKRELYETRTETGEMLSGSTEQLNVQKGTTTLDATETSHIASVSAGFSFAGFGASGGYSYSRQRNTSTQTTRNIATDSSQERRETTSASTTMSQLYQLFNGYHLGTNRAQFVVLPRPHTVSQTGDGGETAFNLIHGQRALEGLQDMFLVVHVPAALQGICVQANLDTGHTVEPPPAEFTDLYGRPLIVTRRVIQACATFDESGRLRATRPRPALTPLPPVAFEALIPGPSGAAALANAATGERARRVQAVDAFNATQAEVRRAMLGGFSLGLYRPRPFVETATFRRLAELALPAADLDLDALVRLRYLTAEEAQTLRAAGVTRTREVFARRAQARSSDAAGGDLVAALHERLLAAVRDAARPRGKGGHGG